MRRVCIFDDKIPAKLANSIDDTLSLNAANLKFLLDNHPWEEKELKDLVSAALGNADWSVSAFTHPRFYFNDPDALPRPEIAIFDWDFGTGESASDLLTQLLESTFCLVCVFTRVDQKHRVEEMLKETKFKSYANRIEVVHKEEVNSVAAVMKKVQDLDAANFSFKFGASLRGASNRAIEKILVELGKTTLRSLGDLLDGGETTDADVQLLIAEKISQILTQDAALTSYLEKSGLPKEKSKEVMAFLSDRVKEEIRAARFDLKPSGEALPSPEISESLWSFRLYFRPTDKIARCGDIIQRDDRFFLVINADCHLNGFWKKNHGHLTVVPLLDLEGQSAEVKKRLLLARKAVTPQQIQFTSLTNKIAPWGEGATILPFAPIDGVRKNFFVFPKEIASIEVPLPGTIAKPDIEPLSYEHSPGITRPCTVSEPFLSPLIQHILGSIGGYGCPDYPLAIRSILSAAVTKAVQ